MVQVTLVLLEPIEGKQFQLVYRHMLQLVPPMGRVGPSLSVDSVEELALPLAINLFLGGQLFIELFDFACNKLSGEGFSLGHGIDDYGFLS